MPINAKSEKIKSPGNSGPAQPNLDPGSYPARLVQVIDLGLQPQRPWKGKEKAPAYEISLTYELLDEFMVDEDGNELEDKPRWISERMPIYSLKADKAKSTLRYYALDPDEVHDGDWSELLGTPCIVTIVQNKNKEGRVFDNIGNVAPMRAREAKNAPELVNDPRIVDLENGSDENCKMFLSMPKWIQDTIKESLEWEATTLHDALQDFEGSQEEDDKESKKERVKKRKSRKPEPEPEVEEDDLDDDDIQF